MKTNPLSLEEVRFLFTFCFTHKHHYAYKRVRNKNNSCTTYKIINIADDPDDDLFMTLSKEDQ